MDASNKVTATAVRVVQVWQVCVTGTEILQINSCSRTMAGTRIRLRLGAQKQSVDDRAGLSACRCSVTVSRASQMRPAESSSLQLGDQGKSHSRSAVPYSCRRRSASSQEPYQPDEPSVFFRAHRHSPVGWLMQRRSIPAATSELAEMEWVWYRNDFEEFADP